MSLVSVYGTSPLECAWSGALNMAADEWLLEQAVQHGRTSLRFYTWASPTVSLGHFQASGSGLMSGPSEPDEERFSHLAWVRRLSGGGAILHHHELTYSCAIPVGHPFSLEPRTLYGAVHEILIDILRRAGVDALLRGRAESDREGNFLCFSRGDPQDIIVGPHKVVGSAQRRRKGAVLQHGSLLLERSLYVPEFPGIRDLGAERLGIRDLVPTLAERLGGLLKPPGGQWEPASFRESDLRELEQLEPKYLLRRGGSS